MRDCHRFTERISVLEHEALEGDVILLFNCYSDVNSMLINDSLQEKVELFVSFPVVGLDSLV